MDDRITDHIEAIHLDDGKFVMAMSGAGTKALSWILEIPGASNTLLEAVVPYSSSGMADFINKGPEKAVSQETASLMAKTAYDRATRLRIGSQKVVGVSCTAALTTNRKRRGSNQAYIGFYGDKFLKVFHLQITKGEFDRSQEEAIVSEVLIDKIANVLIGRAETHSRSSFLKLSQAKNSFYESYEQALLAGHINSVQVDAEGTKTADREFSGSILSGSFNPSHKGHMELAAVGRDILQCDTAFEISVANVDKPNLPEKVILERAKQFMGNSILLMTVAPLFSDKAILYPDCTFLIGWDTAVRLVDQKYYEGSMQKMYRSLEIIESNGCHFLVAGRQVENRFMSLCDVDVPERFQGLFSEIHESKFRMDISSTDIRTS